jgi:hypothetical protein
MAALLIATSILILWGWVSDHIGRKPVILDGFLLAAVTYYPVRARKAGRPNRTSAIIVYPMNALANSQINEIEKFISQSGLAEKFKPVVRRYTGQESQEEQAMASPSTVGCQAARVARPRERHKCHEVRRLQRHQTTYYPLDIC